MALIIFESGAIVVQAKFLKKKGNRWSFRRRIPEYARDLYPTRRDYVEFSLRTSDLGEATRLAHMHAKRQDALWSARKRGEQVLTPESAAAGKAMLHAFGLEPGQFEAYRRADLEPDAFLGELSHLSGGEGEVVRANLPPYAEYAADLYYGIRKEVPFLSDAVKLHQELIAEQEATNAGKARWRNVNVLIDLAGDLPIDQYGRDHAREFVTHFRDLGRKTNTIKRNLTYVQAVFTTALREYELNRPNVFEGIKIPGLGEDAKAIEAYKEDELRKLYTYCLDADDEIRWLLALLADTGMRLAEGCGLRPEDINLEGPIPYLDIKVHAGRRLKTKQSVRIVPLVGSSLWAARRVKEAVPTGSFAFPRYVATDTNMVKATNASNTLIQCLERIGLEGKTVHGLRHTMRDRLRNVNAPENLMDRIGGWAIKSVGERYGQGHSLEVMADWMQQVVLQDVWSRP